MDRTLFLQFNRAYSTEATPEEKQLANDLLTVWGKLEATAGKNPAMYRRGILFGMALQKGIASGDIVLKPVRKNRKAKAGAELPEPGQG